MCCREPAQPPLPNLKTLRLFICVCACVWSGMEMAKLKRVLPVSNRLVIMLEERLGCSYCFFPYWWSLSNTQGRHQSQASLSSSSPSSPSSSSSSSRRPYSSSGSLVVVTHLVFNISAVPCSSTAHLLPWLVTARLSRCPWARHLTLTAPDELAVVFAWLTPPSVCECVYEWVIVRQYCKALWVATGHYRKSAI